MISNNEMVYSLDEHKYVLTREYFENCVNVNLSQILNSDMSVSIDRDPEIFLLRISELLYDFIYEYSENPDDMEYYLSLSDTPKQKKNRDIIKKSLVELGYDIILNNKELGVFYLDKENNNKQDLVTPSVFQKLQGNGLITRSKLVNLPYNYIEKRGVDY